jgi:hypothetical protein
MHLAVSRLLVLPSTNNNSLVFYSKKYFLEYES